MNRIKLISAIILIAFALCLSACSESKEADATPSQKSAAQVSSQAHQTSSAAEDSVLKGSGESEEINGDETNRQVKGGNYADETDQHDSGAADDNDNNSSRISGGSSSPKNNDDSGSQEAEKPQIDSQSSQNDVRQNADPYVGSPSSSVSDVPQVRDNAEVNFNDL